MAFARIVHHTWPLVLGLLTGCLVVVGPVRGPIANAHLQTSPLAWTQRYHLLTSFHVPVPADAKQHGWCYDIATIDPQTDVYYLADDANRQITVIDPQTGHIHGIGTGLFTGIGNCHQGDYSLDGPNGLALAGNQLFAGNGNSHVLVFDKWTGGLLDDISTKGTRRADEMAIGAGHLVVANPDEKPHPYLSFINLRTHRVDQQFAFNDATGGLEQPQFYHGRLFIAVPTTTRSPQGGEVDELDVPPLTHMRIIRTFSFTTCQPAGLAVRNDGIAAVGCANGPAQEILNLNTGQQTAVPGAAGADVVDVYGGDFFYASYGIPALVIADQSGTILQTIPAASAATHTVTVDANGNVWVPQDKGDVNVYAPLQ